MRVSIVALSVTAVVALSSPVLAQSSNANAAAGTGNDKTNFGTVISGLQAEKGADLSTFNADTSQIECVNFSGLSGGGDAAAFDNALTQNETTVASLRADITANTALMDKIKTTCAVTDATDVFLVQSAAPGMFTVYVDDRE